MFQRTDFEPKVISFCFQDCLFEGYPFFVISKGNQKENRRAATCVRACLSCLSLPLQGMRLSRGEDDLFRLQNPCSSWLTNK